jgi:SOS-response transcriptional repressor LexA
MSLELYSALQEAGVKQETARRVADAVDEAIDKRYAIHAKELATRGDIEVTRREIEVVRRETAEGFKTLTVWLAGSVIATAALVVSAFKLL